MITDYLRNALLNHSFAVASFTMPSTIYAALYTIAPTVTTGGLEVSASDYRRVATSWNASASGVITNGADIRFPASGVSSSNWSNPIALGFCDAPTAGNLLWSGPLSAGVVMISGSDIRLAAGQVLISIPS